MNKALAQILTTQQNDYGEWVAWKAGEWSTSQKGEVRWKLEQSEASDGVDWL